MFNNQLPGGNRFRDIYGLIEDATDELAHGGLLIMDNFGLQDAMSAIEIMDDRMDSGTRPPETRFSSETLLLPQEVCWILDKAFAAEMTWHSGVSLAQSILTLQHVHHIPKMRHLRAGHYNPDKPPELVGLVLRAGILGLVKCVDLVWRELAKNNAHDGEDWHGEKFEVSLCEGVAAATVVDSLDEALTWLEGEKRVFAGSSDPSPNDLQMLHWYTLLIHRLELRRAILLALSRSLASEAEEMAFLLEDAQADLDRIRQTEPPPEPSPDSPALYAIDQHICRSLTVLMPVKIIPLFDQPTTWQWLHHLIAGLLDIAKLSSCERLLSWQTYARIHAWAFDIPRRTPFLRSLLMTAFMSGTLVLGRYQSPWLVDHYLSQVARVPQATLVHLHESGRISMTSTNGITSASILQRFENDVIANLKDYFYSYFENRPRQRRKLSNMLLELHKLHAQARAMSEQAPVVEGMLLVLHSLRLNAILEVVLSGFELQLYSREEDPFVYWYASYIVEQRTDVLRDTLKHLFLLDDSEDHSAIDYATCELDFATAILKALKGSSLVLRLLDRPLRPHDAHRTRLSVERRFKWAFLRDYAVIPLEDEARPDLDLFALAPEQKLQGQELLHEAARLFDDAAEAFSRLRDRGPVASGSELCQDAFQEFIHNLIEVCTSNSGFLRVAQTYQSALRWEVQLDGWFQRVKGFTPAV